jgi:predicted ArsR family transcriptional regulator
VEGIKRHLTRDEIAAELGINSRVVKDHVQALCERYDCPARELPEKIGL